MNETLELIDNLAVVAIIGFTVLSLVMLIILYKTKERDKLRRRFQLVDPMGHLCFAVIFFTLLVDMFLRVRVIDRSITAVVLMVTVLVIGLRGTKLGRKAETYEQFRAYAWKQFAYFVFVGIAMYWLITTRF
jgi:xanthine/uracil permease